VKPLRAEAGPAHQGQVPQFLAFYYPCFFSAQHPSLLLFYISSAKKETSKPPAWKKINHLRRGVKGKISIFEKIFNFFPDNPLSRPILSKIAHFSTQMRKLL
jgi:hypothetical protein